MGQIGKLYFYLLLVYLLTWRTIMFLYLPLYSTFEVIFVIIIFWSYASTWYFCCLLLHICPTAPLSYSLLASYSAVSSERWENRGKQDVSQSSGHCWHLLVGSIGQQWLSLIAEAGPRNLAQRLNKILMSEHHPTFLVPVFLFLLLQPLDVLQIQFPST